MKRTAIAFAAALAAATTPALANHGAEYEVSTCGADGNTAHMTITTVGDSQHNAETAVLLQDSFTTMMKSQSAADHAAVKPAYVAVLTNTFSATTEKLLAATGQPMVYLDFHHPLKTGPMTPGCK